MGGGGKGLAGAPPPPPPPATPLFHELFTVATIFLNHVQQACTRARARRIRYGAHHMPRGVYCRTVSFPDRKGGRKLLTFLH